MGGRFGAFSFVDRITEVVPGMRARGSYQVPKGLDAFPSALAAEAVGQLAAWASMARLEFRRALDMLAIGYVISRALHGAFYIMDLGALRSLAYLAGMVCAVSIFFFVP